MSYIDEIYTRVVERSPGENEFHQTVKEVLDSLKSVIDANEEKYEKVALLERLVEPEGVVLFRVSQADDNDQVQANKAYRVQFNNAIGSYKGGLRSHPSVNQGILKFLGFEQTFKNSLAGLPISDGKGDSNFDPKGKLNREVMALYQSLMTELHGYIGKDQDVPTEDIGVDAGEIGYLYKGHKKITDFCEGALTDKGLTYGGSLIRIQAIGYGLVYAPDKMLKNNGKELSDKTILVSGSGNATVYIVEKVYELGGRVAAMSDSNGYIYDKDGIKLDTVEDIKEMRRGRIKEYVDAVPTAAYTEGKGIWTIPCDITLLCVTQNESNLDDVKALLENGCSAVAGGANTPSTREATDFSVEKKMLFMPSRAVNIGDVATSALEQPQDGQRSSWTAEEVDAKLKGIMVNISAKVDDAVERYGVAGNYVASADIAGFEKIAEAMMAQGVV